MTDAGGGPDVGPAPPGADVGATTAAAAETAANAFDARPTVIRLGQFLKFAGLAGSGGEAKLWIADGMVSVNGHVETRRRRQLKNGDIVAVDGAEAVVDLPVGGAEPDDA